MPKKNKNNSILQWLKTTLNGYLYETNCILGNIRRKVKIFYMISHELFLEAMIEYYDPL